MAKNNIVLPEGFVLDNEVEDQSPLPSDIRPPEGFQIDGSNADSKPIGGDVLRSIAGNVGRGAELADPRQWPDKKRLDIKPDNPIDIAASGPLVAGRFPREQLAAKVIPQFTKGLYESDLPFAKQIATMGPNSEIIKEVQEGTPSPEGVIPFLARASGRFSPELVMMSTPIKAAGMIPKLSSLGQIAIGSGAYTGVKDVLQGKFKEAVPDTLKTVAGVWAGGKVLEKGLAPALGYAGKGIIKAIPAASMALKTISGKLDENELGQFIKHSIDKAIRPSIGSVGKGSAEMLDKYHQRARTAVEDIIKNKSTLAIKDEAGNVTNKLPENLDEFLQATNQRMHDIFNRYNSIANEAGEAGIKVDLGGIADDVLSAVNKPEVRVFFPDLQKYALDLHDNLLKEGSMSPQSIQKAIAMLNDATKRYYRNPNASAASELVINIGLLSKLRKGLDDAVGGLKGMEYGTLKKQYGAYRGLLDDLLKRTLVDARKNTKGFFDLTDVLIHGDIARGLLTLNPAEIVRGGVMKMAKNAIKKINDPNRIVRDMFRFADKTMRRNSLPSTAKKTPAMLEGPTGQRLIEGPSRKLLGVTEMAGEGFERLTPIESRKVFEGQLNKVSEALGQMYRKALPHPQNLGEGFERVQRDEAFKRLGEFANRFWSPTEHKMIIPEGIIKSEKTTTLLKAMGVNPFTGEIKSPLIKASFQIAWKRAKKIK